MHRVSACASRQTVAVPGWHADECVTVRDVECRPMSHLRGGHNVPGGKRHSNRVQCRHVPRPSKARDVRQMPCDFFSGHRGCNCV
eukprot:3056171-Prymnesium_polylepis.2